VASADRNERTRVQELADVIKLDDRRGLDALTRPRPDSMLLIPARQAMSRRN
jgi:hypothetical protein